MLSFGEGDAPGFAYRLAKNYISRGVRGNVVTVDMKPAEYPLPPNMAHVTGDAIDFLKSLPTGSVERTHDYFAAHYIALGKRANEAGDEAQRLVADMRAGNSTAARLFAARKRELMEKMRDYSLQLHRVTKPGGKLVLVSNTLSSAEWMPLLKRAGFRITFSREVETGAAAKLGAASAGKYIARGTSVYAIIARKPQ